MMKDERLFPLPDLFDGFRFVEADYRAGIGQTQPRVAAPATPRKFTEVSDNALFWGTGKTAW